MDSKFLIVVGALIVVQLALQVTAVVQLVKTPAERVTLGGRKWAWALIIVMGEIIGPIAWFMAGRTAATVSDEGQSSSGSTKSAVDSLYSSQG